MPETNFVAVVAWIKKSSKQFVPLLGRHWTGRFACSMNFPYSNEWNGNFYETKQVRPIFVDETNEIVVITVYTYFF